MTPVVSVVALSGTGKTTLVIKLIAALKAKGYRVGAIKHDAHKFDIDHPGKDSWRMTQAGADTMMITSSAKIAMVKQNVGAEPTLEETVNAYFSDVDIVISEGFKRSAVPKIEVCRQGKTSAMLCRGENHDPLLMAVATDQPMAVDVPTYDINDVDGLCELIIQKVLR